MVKGDVPHCYLLLVCSGSSVDQHSNNPSLFNLVEHISIAPNTPPPPNGVIPLEVHTYWKLDPTELSVEFHVRLVMVSSSGLETFGPTFKHKSSTTRFRTRTMGLPFPPVPDDYKLMVEWKFDEHGDFYRHGSHWPVSIRIMERKPVVTH